MSEDTKLKELIINTLSPEQMPEVLSETEIYLVEDDVEYASIEELATKQDVITDLDTIRSNASNAVNVNATNLSTQGKEIISSLSAPSNRYIDLTLGATGTTYTALANGWFLIHKKTTTSNQYVWATNNTTRISHLIQSPVVGDICFYIPARKNDIVQIGYNANGTTQSFKFIYAEGAI